MSRTDDYDWGGITAEEPGEETDTYDGPDPHGIVPEDFAFASIHDAAREADRSDDVREDPRCPDCLSPNVGRKPGAATAAPSHQRDGQYRCHRCGAHSDSLAEPAIEMPTCGGCGRQLHVRCVGLGAFRCQRCEREWQTLGGVGDGE